MSEERMSLLKLQILFRLASIEERRNKIDVSMLEKFYIKNKKRFFGRRDRLIKALETRTKKENASIPKELFKNIDFGKKGKHITREQFLNNKIPIEQNTSSQEASFYRAINNLNTQGYIKAQKDKNGKFYENIFLTEKGKVQLDTMLIDFSLL